MEKLQDEISDLELFHEVDDERAQEVFNQRAEDIFKKLVREMEKENPLPRCLKVGSLLKDFNKIIWKQAAFLKSQLE